MQEIKLLLPANLTFSSSVRGIAQESAVIANFHKTKLNFLRLIIDELFMNAVRYGSNKDSTVFVHILINGDQISCAIEDQGKGEVQINAEALREIIADETSNVSLYKQHGRGLAQITSTQVEAYEINNTEDGGIRFEFLMTSKPIEKKAAKVSKIVRKKDVLAEKEIKLSGGIDGYNIVKIKEEVEEILDYYKDDGLRLILNLKDLHYCNSNFLGAVASWGERVISNKGELILRHPNQDIYEILDLVGLTKIFIVENND